MFKMFSRPRALSAEQVQTLLDQRRPTLSSDPAGKRPDPTDQQCQSCADGGSCSWCGGATYRRESPSLDFRVCPCCGPQNVATESGQSQCEVAARSSGEEPKAVAGGRTSDDSARAHEYIFYRLVVAGFGLGRARELASQPLDWLAHYLRTCGLDPARVPAEPSGVRADERRPLSADELLGYYHWLSPDEFRNLAEGRPFSLTAGTIHPKEQTMRTQVVVDHIVLTREQVERAYKELNAPEPLKPFPVGAQVKMADGNLFIVPSEAVSYDCQRTFGPVPDHQFVICIATSNGRYIMGGGYQRPLSSLRLA